MKHRPMDFEEMDRLFSYESETGDILNKVDRGVAGAMALAGTIATSKIGNGYLVVRFTRNGRQVEYKAHRVAWLLHTGEDPGDMQIDHIDGQRDRNNFSNLRLVDNQGNMMNQRKYKNNTSGVMGISWNKRDKVWYAYICRDGRQKCLGLFDDKFEAICARKSAERRLGYHENHGK